MTATASGTVLQRIVPAALARPALRKALDLARRGLTSRHPAVLDASAGRSGSTLVYDAIAERLATDRCGLARRRAAQRIARSSAFLLDQVPLENENIIYSQARRMIRSSGTGAPNGSDNNKTLRP